MPRLVPKSNKLLQGALPKKVAMLKKAHPEAQVELWTGDEIRLGLKPLIRRVWAPNARRPTAKVRRRY
jgi:hypothetical protein